MTSRSKTWNRALSSPNTEGSLSQSNEKSCSDSNSGSQASKPSAPSRSRRKETGQILAALDMVKARPQTSKVGKARQCNKVLGMFDATQTAEVTAYLNASNASKVDRPVVPDPKDLSANRGKKQLISL
eukprot:TRINITY_DN11514_c0_g1_i1.p2 TRINITY_DN11514_c0_g1~~TRINITY_DN11514_c0_g1_i1.p2  ORF type:complete len:128 (+),score=18.99 TRINITY_DN11514_c0_g1_i1:239-622(+)